MVWSDAPQAPQRLELVPEADGRTMEAPLRRARAAEAASNTTGLASAARKRVRLDGLDVVIVLLFRIRVAEAY